MTDSTLNRFLSEGTNAQRLAFTPSAPTPASGPTPCYIWFETDTSNTYAYNIGTLSWVKVNTGGGGGLTPFDTTNLGGTANHTFAVPAGSNSLKFVGQVRSASTGGSPDILLFQINGDTTAANYVNQRLLSTGGTIVAASFSVAGIYHDVSSNTSGVPANDASPVNFEIPDYAGTTFTKNGNANTTIYNAVPQFFQITYGFKWINTAAITSVKVLLSSGANFATGSILSGYVY